MSDIDSILKEITEIDERLDELPSDAFEERFQLRERHQELRQQAATLAADADRNRPTEEVEAEYAALQSRLDAIMDERIDMVSQSGGGGAAGSGAEGLGAQSLNWQIEQAQGADKVRERMAYLRDILQERGIDPDAEGDG